MATDRASRDPRVDLFRGIALLVIAVDHVVNNPVTKLTPVSWGYSDMAEVFLFLSGYVAGLSALKRRSLHQNVFTRFLARSAQIYLAYVVTTCLLLVLVRHPFPGVPSHFGENLLTGPWMLTIQDVLLLRGIASHLCILILYMFLLSTFPIILALCRWKPTWIFLFSFSLYVWAQTGGTKLPEPLIQTAYYNPFAWQFIFYLGTVVALSADEKKSFLEYRVTLLSACWIVGTLHLLHAFGMVPVEWRLKPTLGLLRVVHFAGLAIIVQAIVPQKLSISSWPVWSCMACGRHSLLIYCTGAVISAVASIWVTQSGRDPWDYVLANLFVIATLIALAGNREYLANN